MSKRKKAPAVKLVAPPPPVEDFGEVQLAPEPEKKAATTEQEILDCLKENLKLASEDCDRLAKGERGHVYVQFRERLKLVEGASRQMMHWREDTRWSPFAVKISECQKRCGQWLREKEPAWRFSGLAQILRHAWLQAHELETRKTGKLGAILPIVRNPVRTEGRSVGVILPPGFVRQPIAGETKH